MKGQEKKKNILLVIKAYTQAHTIHIHIQTLKTKNIPMVQEISSTTETLPLLLCI